MKQKTKENIIYVIVIIAITLFILQYYKPELMLLRTTTTGGDMGSDYYPALYLKEELVPNGRLVGWCPGWYLGMPMFQFYFLPAFVLMVFLSYIISLEIAFKIVTALGIFLLPVCTLISFRLMRIKFPGPAIAAAFTLPFLFMEANSMWGGNIPSTLAGEFSYSISLAITVLFFGLIYRTIEKGYSGKNIALCSVLFALIVLTHMYTAMFVFFCSLFFLFHKKHKESKKRFFLLFRLYLISFLLSAFWLVPLLGNLSYTTAYADTWLVSIDKIFPAVILIFLPLAAVTIFAAKKEKPVLYLFFSVVIAYALFLLAESFGTVNIRFVPFIQLFLMLLAAIGLNIIINRKNFRGKWVAPFIVLIIVLIWVQSNVSYIDKWIAWNYEGFEMKNEWNRFKAVNDFLNGSQNDPRVVFEHSSSYNAAGTVRAFESLPLFSGRSNMEGLFMQSSHSSPFVFYVQSEMSEQNSCPFWRQYPCTQLNISKGTEHLKMLNVRHFIARSDRVKEELAKNSEYQLAKKIDYYEIYELKTNPNQYVTVPENEPLCIEGSWKNISYQWFKTDDIDVPLVFSCEEKFERISRLDEIRRKPVGNNCQITERIENEKISFSTSCIGKPHIISVSYHPSWRVEGAKKVYLVSPAFMLVYPEQENVRLYFGDTIYDSIGNILTIAGIIALIYLIFSRNHSLRRFLKR